MVGERDHPFAHRGEQQSNPGGGGKHEAHESPRGGAIRHVYAVIDSLHGFV